MAGTEGIHGGSQDLLRQATQRMMSRMGDDDSHDNIEGETPRSGIATPQPDPVDKRLPGIMHNYFGQVGLHSSTPRSLSGPLEIPALGTESDDPLPIQRREDVQDVSLQRLSSLSLDAQGSSPVEDDEEPVPLLPHELPECIMPSSIDPHVLHSYPTPPFSGPPSLRRSGSEDHDSRIEPISKSASASKSTPSHHRRFSEALPRKARSASIFNPLSTIVSTSPVHAAHFSNPCGVRALSTDNTPHHSRVTSNVSVELQNSLSYERLKKLTENAGLPREKSNSPTPTRALSNQTSASEGSGGEPAHSGVSQTSAPQIGTAAAISAALGASSSSGAPVQAARGKLTVKITEARGLRRSKDPYLVATFQRNELVSKGPRPAEDTDGDDEFRSPAGAISMSRQGSESGRPMAIPMKSRQSSSVSLTEHRDFKMRTRKSMTNPKWDTEAIFDVVGDDSHVNISIYDRGSASEEFLGKVDFDPKLMENDPIPVTGWYPLQGLQDTESVTTGDVYVEITFQKTEKKHYGPEDFKVLKLIGRGTFGQVYQVRKYDTRRIYAMKVLQKKVIVQKKEVAHTVGERNILVRTATTDSPFIVGLKFSFQTPTDLYLVTDYMSGGELFWHLQKEGRFEEKRAKFYIAELILALQHLHTHDIVYRDLKPENILLDANGHIALCDFGLSKANLTKDDTTNTFCGTTEYLAPEVLLDEAGYTKMVDFWSLGVLVFEMCCGWSPFYAEDIQQMYKNIAFGKVRFPRDSLSTEGRNFVKGLLNRNPKHRLGATDDAEELKRHPFFADIDWEALTKKLITPPFKPKLKSETDTSNFDPEFTNALNGASSLNARAAALASGIATSTPLSPTMQANFKGFTFVDESSIEENMRGRVKDDYDEMDEDEKRDQEWEDPFDIPNRNGGDRMSGIIKTHTNEDQNMFNGGNMDI